MDDELEESPDIVDVDSTSNWSLEDSSKDIE